MGCIDVSGMAFPSVPIGVRQRKHFPYGAYKMKIKDVNSDLQRHAEGCQSTAAFRQSENGNAATTAMSSMGWTSDPNGFLRRLFPTAHELLVKRSLMSLKLPMFHNVLVAGAGHDPYRSLFRRSKVYIRLDIKPTPGITDVVGDGVALPFQARQFDCIFASEVLEHISKPFLFAEELSRVLRPGGTIILTVPFMFHKHGDPYDYWRPTEQGMRELFKSFANVKVRSLGNRLHVISDLITTAFSPYPVLFPLRIFNHVLRLLPTHGNNRLPSMSPSGYLVIARKQALLKVRNDYSGE